MAEAMTIFQYPKCAHGHYYGMCHICEGAGEMRKGDGNFVEKLGGTISPTGRHTIGWDSYGNAEGWLEALAAGAAEMDDPATYGYAKACIKEIKRLKSELQEAKDVIQGLEQESAAYKRMWEDAMDVIKRWQDRQVGK